ncbi:MAG TPA: ribosome biogenesis GTPase Der [Gammaproteobacteria bacterium]|nr:ribosome biogenesis GTPase Der [Gammaproteobacteria bacterium]
MLPVVAIVGKPNVGKSTLFNRLTATRNALVSDFPGMTRDRQYGTANIDDHRFIVIDTGGMTESADKLDQLITEQALQAIEEADKVIFLVDGRNGITVEDQAIVEKIRRLKKPVYLVVNKTEGFDPTLAVADFFRLGLGNPYPIAAAHGRGISNLLAAIFPKTEEAEEATEGKVAAEPQNSGVLLALVGRPNVGKSTLTNRLLGEERVIVSNIPGTTRDSIYIPLERFGKHYTLIDTAGMRRRKNIEEVTEKFSIVKTLQSIESANVVLFVIDGREAVTDQDLRLLGFVLESGKSLIVAINKWDNMSEEEREETKESVARRLHFLSAIRIQYISALHGTGVGHLWDYVDEAYESATKKFSTSYLTELLEQAVAAFSPPLVSGRRVKLRYAHTGGHNPPIIVIHGSMAEKLPLSYQKYLAGFYQKRLQLVGTPVQIKMKEA